MALGSLAAAHAESWLPITPEELQMKIEPNAPAAAAIYLYRQIDRDDSAPVEVVYERIKPRVHPIEFEAPEQDTDTFEITLPKGYVVDELPPAVHVDLGFASYRSKTEMTGGVLRYARTLEIREVSVPAARAGELKRFYRIIENDERMSAVLKRASP